MAITKVQSIDPLTIYVYVYHMIRYMMTSSNGNLFRVTDPLCGEFTGEFSALRPVTRSFDVFFGLRLNKRLSKQSWGWWFETPSRPVWRHCNENSDYNCSKPTGKNCAYLMLMCLSLCHSLCTCGPETKVKGTCYKTSIPRIYTIR